ncbi:MAG: hypothetical protein WBW48_13330 [Anaerolineae bacterium]
MNLQDRIEWFEEAEVAGYPEWASLIAILKAPSESRCVERAQREEGDQSENDASISFQDTRKGAHYSLSTAMK